MQPDQPPPGEQGQHMQTHMEPFQNDDEDNNKDDDDGNYDEYYS